MLHLLALFPYRNIHSIKNNNSLSFSTKNKQHNYNTKPYEYLLKKILKDYKLRKNREFYNITENEIILIYDFFNELNRELNTHDKLLEYIKKTDIKYYKKIIKKKDKCNIKRKKEIYIDTSNLI